MIYIHNQKLKDVFGVLLESKRSFWGIFREVEAVVLGYFWRNRRSRFGALFTENLKLVNSIKKNNIGERHLKFLLHILVTFL
jgi:hypothetical protein